MRWYDVATAIGAVGGAAVGANVNLGTQVQTQKCSAAKRFPALREPSTGT